MQRVKLHDVNASTLRRSVDFLSSLSTALTSAPPSEEVTKQYKGRPGRTHPLMDSDNNSPWRRHPICSISPQSVHGNNKVQRNIMGLLGVVWVRHRHFSSPVSPVVVHVVYPPMVDDNTPSNRPCSTRGWAA